MAILSTIKELIYHLVDPWLFMSISICFLPGTVLELITSADLRTLLSPSAFKEAWFGNFWAFIGPQVKTSGERRVIPLLEGRLRDGQIHDDVVSEPLSGVVLEIGAGSGMWADVFAKIDGGVDRQGEDDGGDVRRRKGGNGLTRVYGIEPNPQSAAALWQRIRDVGLEGIYEVVPVGIESLNDPTAWQGRIAPRSVDCVVTILCLCSIPEPEKNIKLLYECLKKGGRWYAYEHVQVDRVFLLRVYQWLTNLVWSQVVGSCRICRATGKTLREVGPWEKIDLAQPVGESRFAVLPHLVGTLTK